MTTTRTRTRRPNTATRRASRYAHQLSCHMDVTPYILDGSDACWVAFSTTPNQDPLPKMVITAHGSYAIAWPVPKSVTNPYLTAAQYLQASQSALMTATVLR